MNFASAYPNSAVSPLVMMAIGFVVVGALALWLGLVFLADRKSSEREAREADSYLVVVASPDQTAEDKHSEADSGQAAHRHSAAA
jgi:hypothetical protein